jgi:hypothetical protein
MTLNTMFLKYLLDRSVVLASNFGDAKTYGEEAGVEKCRDPTHSLQVFRAEGVTTSSACAGVVGHGEGSLKRKRLNLIGQAFNPHSNKLEAVRSTKFSEPLAISE